MKSTRKRKAILGRVAPATTTTECSRLWKVTGDAKQLHFRQLWAREEECVSLTLSDVLDFALNRTVKHNDREYRIGFCPGGIYFREKGNLQRQMIPYADLVAILEGLTLLPIAP